jgi:hypothetical protein
MRLTGAALVILSSLVPAAATAEEAVPDLVGTWTGAMKEMRWEGPAEGPLELRLTEQDGPLLRGEKGWTLEPGSTPGSVEGKLVTEAVEPLIGVIDFDGRTFYLAEQGDTGTYHGRLVDADTIEMVYLEAGEVATVYRVVLKRTR